MADVENKSRHQFDLECTRLKNHMQEPSKDKKKRELQRWGSEICDQVTSIFSGRKNLSSQDIDDLTAVLHCANATWSDRFDVNKSKAHAQELAALSQRVSGKSSPGWKALGNVLLIFACAALVFVGVLAFIPSGGSSLLLSVIGGAGLTATIGVGAGTAAIGVLGAAARYHSYATERLAKSVHFFREALCAIKAELSPFDVTKLDSGASNMLEDWNRLDAGPVSIDGVPIEQLIREESSKKDDSLESSNSEVSFKDQNHLNEFIKRHLLKNINQNQQDNALKQIQCILHQGGLLNPVSASAFVYFKNMEFQPCDARNKDKAGVPGQRREINFTTTDDGFKIKEIVTQNRFIYTMAAGNKAGEDVLPDEGHDYIYKAQATLNIKFSPNSSGEMKYEIKVESSTILYGNEMIENKMIEAEAANPAPRVAHNERSPY